MYENKQVNCKYHFSSNVDYTVIYDEDYILKVDAGGFSISLYLNLKEKSDKIIICGPSAIDSRSIKPPIFHRWSWAKKLPYSTIIISDPTLETGEFNVGWFLGNNESHHLPKVVNVIIKLISQLSISRENTFFYGSSAGGFSSLMMAAFFRGSKAIVQNPQIDVSKYHGDFFNDLVKNNYNGEPPNNECLNVISLYKKIRYIPDVYYIQNTYDTHHFDIHFKLFIDGISSLREEFKTNCNMFFDIYSNSNSGHNADSFDIAYSRINRAISYFENKLQLATSSG